MTEEGCPRLDGVERVFAEHEGARGRRRPGVDQGNLNGPETVGRSSHEAAGFVVDEAHAGQLVEVAAEVAEAPVDSADDVLVDLDCGHRPRAEASGREDVAPAAGANHERV